MAATTLPLPTQIHQAIVTDWAQPPAYQAVDFPPTAKDDNTLTIKVLATCVHRLVRARASGKHYSIKTPPHLPGVDGVGLVYPELKRLVYFFSWTEGSLADYVRIPRDSVFDVPGSSVADLTDISPSSLAVHVAAALNPAMSSYMALRRRLVTQIQPGKETTVLILGATSSSGVTGAQISRALGAKRVVGAGRSAASLRALEPPLDDIVELQSDTSKTDFARIGPVDIVLDYLYGDVATAFLAAAKTPPGRPLQYLQIGQLAGPTIQLSGGALRGRDITIRGAGIGSWSDDEFKLDLPGLLDVVVKLPRSGVRVESLKDVEKVWDESEADASRRLVFVP